MHLTAPGWNVAGATPPWLPGVMLGHNERIAWGMAGFDADTQDLFVERVNPDNLHQVDVDGRWTDTRILVHKLWVKGRPAPVETASEITPHGPSLAVDRERRLAFALRWSGSEPGGAAGLAALALSRAGTWTEFRAALSRWKAPAQEVLYADVDGNIGSQVAALVPARPGWNGSLPAAGWTRRHEWDGWLSMDQLPHSFNPSSGHVISANRSAARVRRLEQVFGGTRKFDVNAFARLQRDVVATNAERIVPLLARLRAPSADVDRARGRLNAWDRRMTGDSTAATVYVAWEEAVIRLVAAGRIQDALVDEFVARHRAVLIDAVVAPSRLWFDGDVESARDRVLVRALQTAVDDLRRIAGEDESAWRWGVRRQALFEHPLGVSGPAAARFNVGPFAVPGYVDTVMSTDGRSPAVRRAASYSAVYDLSDWDRSVALNAPGQSGSPSSPHFKDLAQLWADGSVFPLLFTEAAVRTNAESTLMLVPPGR